jgi:uncharacterized protein YlzI (FlbEa/FlbD family)
MYFLELLMDLHEELQRINEKIAKFDRKITRLSEENE